MKKFIHPDKFQITNEGEYAVHFVWTQLEYGNLVAFFTTYLPALHRGLPVSCFYQFLSEIKQDPCIEKPGAVFNTKVNQYFSNKMRPRRLKK